MPHIIKSIEAAPVKAIATDEVEDIVRAEINKESSKGESIDNLFSGGKVFGSVDVPHTICGKPYDECCKNKKGA